SVALAAVDAVPGPPASVETGRVQPFPAEVAGAVGPGERCDDEVTGLHRAHLGSGGFDDADELVAHPLAGLAVLHLVVRPQVAAADAGAGDTQKGVGRLDEAGVGDVVDPDVAGAVHDSCSHAHH